MKAKSKTFLGYFAVVLILYAVGKQCGNSSTQLPEESKIYQHHVPDTSPRTAPLRQGESQSTPRRDISSPPYLESDIWNRPNMTMDGDEGINPADAEPTEYDLMYEDPDLYDFIAD